jgi:hypothetical protein
MDNLLLFSIGIGMMIPITLYVVVVTYWLRREEKRMLREEKRINESNRILLDGLRDAILELDLEYDPSKKPK